MSRYAHFCALLAAIFFGLMSPAIKYVLENTEASGVVVTTTRLAGAAALFWLLSLFLPKQKIERSDYLSLFLMAMCGMVLNQYPIIIGLQYTAPSHATLAASMTPITALIIARVIFKESIGWRRATGVLIAFAGVSSLVLASAVGGGGGSMLGDALCLMSQCFATCYFVFFVPIFKKYHPVILLRWLFLIATILASPFVTSSMFQAGWQSFDMSAAFSLSYVVFFGTFIAYLLLVPAQRYLPPSVVVIYNYVQPVVALALGIYLGLESFSLFKLAAIGLIIIGVSIVTRRTVQSKSIQEKPPI